MDQLELLKHIKHILKELHGEFINLRDQGILPLLDSYSNVSKSQKGLLENTLKVVENIQNNVQIVSGSDHIQEIRNVKLKELAQRGKGTIKLLWSQKLNAAKQTYTSLLTNRGKADIFSQWVENERFLPNKFRQKMPDDTSEEQTEIIQKMGFMKMKSEVITLRAMAQKHQTKFDQLMDSMTTHIQEQQSSNVAEAMQRLWIEDIEIMRKKADTDWKAKEEWWTNLPNNPNQDTDINHADDNEEENEGTVNNAFVKVVRRKRNNTVSQTKKSQTANHCASYADKARMPNPQTARLTEQVSARRSFANNVPNTSTSDRRAHTHQGHQNKGPTNRNRAGSVQPYLPPHKRPYHSKPEPERNHNRYIQREQGHSGHPKRNFNPARSYQNRRSYSNFWKSHERQRYWGYTDPRREWQQGFSYRRNNKDSTQMNQPDHFLW